MPTTRPRHTITETETIERALESAARRWPEDRGSRKKLLIRLIEEGEQAIGDARAGEVDRRRAAIERSAGALTGVYPDGHPAELRRDWPE